MSLVPTIGNVDYTMVIVALALGFLVYYITKAKKDEIIYNGE